MLKKEYGPYGPQGPWTNGPQGPWAQILRFGKFSKFDKSCSKGPILNPQIGPDDPRKVQTNLGKT